VSVVAGQYLSLVGGLHPEVTPSAAIASMLPSWRFPSSSTNVPPGGNPKATPIPATTAMSATAPIATEARTSKRELSEAWPAWHHFDDCTIDDLHRPGRVLMYRQGPNLPEADRMQSGCEFLVYGAAHTAVGCPPIRS
jgi:hypothetical protein